MAYTQRLRADNLIIKQYETALNFPQNIPVSSFCYLNTICSSVAISFVSWNENSYFFLQRYLYKNV